MSAVINHFWSIGGVECLWCFRRRSAQEIAAWEASGKPEEPCMTREQITNIPLIGSDYCESGKCGICDRCRYPK